MLELKDRDTLAVELDRHLEKLFPVKPTSGISLNLRDGFVQVDPLRLSVTINVQPIGTRQFAGVPVHKRLFPKDSKFEIFTPKADVKLTGGEDFLIKVERTST